MSSGFHLQCVVCLAEGACDDINYDSGADGCGAGGGGL